MALDLNYQTETVHLRSGLEPTQPGLEPGQNSDWDSNPRGRDSNPAKTLIGTWTHTAGTRTHVAGIRTGPKPTVFQVRSHTWFQDLMKLRFLMSHCRKNSVRDKVMGKKWIYLERSTLHRQSAGHLRRWERHQGVGLSVFIGVGNFIGQWVGEGFQLFREGVGISRNWATAHFLILMVGLGTVMVPVGVPFSLLICYSECILRLKV